MSQILDRNGELTKIIIISVSILGTILLILNILVVSYFVHKKKTDKKTKHEEGIFCFFIFILEDFSGKRIFLPINHC